MRERRGTTPLAHTGVRRSSAGDLLLTLPEAGTVSDYRRDLNLDTAVARVAYTTNGVRFTREGWIWLGAVAMALGGLISLSDRRHRVGAPARRRREVAAAVAQAAE